MTVPGDANLTDVAVTRRPSIMLPGRIGLLIVIRNRHPTPTRPSTSLIDSMRRVDFFPNQGTIHWPINSKICYGGSTVHFLDCLCVYLLRHLFHDF